jgi:hypothetical protein
MKPAPFLASLKLRLRHVIDLYSQQLNDLMHMRLGAISVLHLTCSKADVVESGIVSSYRPSVGGNHCKT